MINVVSIFAAITSMLSAWYFAQGRLRPSYWCQALAGVAFIYLNGIVGCEHHAGAFMLFVPAGWSIAMSFKGLRRLNDIEEVGQR